MKLWLDDIRIPLPGYHVWVKSSGAAIEQLRTGKYTEVSLDHDLGAFAGDGYEVSKFLEEQAFNNTLPAIMIYIHTANSAAASRMYAAGQQCCHYWRGHNKPVGYGSYSRNYDWDVSDLLEKHSSDWRDLRAAWERVFDQHRDNIDAVMTLL